VKAETLQASPLTACFSLPGVVIDGKLAGVITADGHESRRNSLLKLNLETSVDRSFGFLTS